MRTQFGARAFAMAAGITVLPHAAVAAEIKIMCPAPMRTAIVDLAARFERKTPHKITFIHLPSSFIVDRVKGGEAVDVTILTARASDDLIKEGKLARRVDIARSQHWHRGAGGSAQARCLLGRGVQANAAGGQVVRPQRGSRKRRSYAPRI